MKKPELLAPAGSLQAAETAIRYGADALYAGGPMLQLRAESVGFDEEELARLAALAHEHGKRCYVAVNSVTYDRDFPALGPYARRLWDMGIDALIVSDIGAIAVIREAAPSLEIHLSTQANCSNSRAAIAYHQLGVKRIVLARELSLEDIAAMKRAIPPDLELEAFVHGAMCMAYSGRCLISSFLTGRSANRGDCAQSCRWRYQLIEAKRPEEAFPVFEEEGATTILSSRELCGIGLLDQLEEAGVSCFKIEGRMRTPYSIGIVINAYRMRMDGSISLQTARRELDTISHRPYTEAFYRGEGALSAQEDEGLLQRWQFVAVAREGGVHGDVVVQVRNKIEPGDELEVVSPGMPGRPFVVENLRDENGIGQSAANVPMSLAVIDCPWPLQKGDFFRKALP